ncbi:hypothetical protein AGMMS49928_08350 [Spirochaetia bacterium]|nr:hypothetical protein AGMMS49928_08350 [Spirochaetia bacterium]
MKIKTQFHLLIAGILIVPLLFIIGGAIYVQITRQQESAEIAVYEDIAAMLDEQMDFNDREAFSHFIYRLSRFADIAVFRNDFLVLHSTIPDFTAGDSVPSEKIFSLLLEEDPQYAYSFEAPGWLNNHGYILIRRGGELPQGFPLGPLFLPVIIGSSLFLMLIIFAIAMSLLIARSITKSVLILENATRRIAEGELDLAVEIRGSNEITSLTNSLNRMRNALKEEELRRSRFIMGVTHDLKTPLALIKAYTEAIEDGITEDPATHTSATEIISAKVDQLESMINDLLEFVRMDTGEWRGKLQKVTIAAFLRNTVKAFSADAELLRHEFNHEIAVPENLCIPMDESLALRALENLVNNAIRYTPDGSVISLNAGIAGTTMQITVSDNGPGIDKADLPHIFELFYRGTSSRREQGMGLGLAVVKWVVDSHNWTIEAHSEREGKTGTCFCITVPLENGGH